MTGDLDMKRKYDPLQKHLQAQASEKVTLGFMEIEMILGFDLPDSARTWPAWWENEDPSTTRHTPSRAWTLAGRTATADLSASVVTFSKWPTTGLLD